MKDEVKRHEWYHQLRGLQMLEYVPFQRTSNPPMHILQNNHINPISVINMLSHVVKMTVCQPPAISIDEIFEANGDP